RRASGSRTGAALSCRLAAGSGVPRTPPRRQRVYCRDLLTSGSGLRSSFVAPSQPGCGDPCTSEKRAGLERAFEAAFFGQTTAAGTGRSVEKQVSAEPDGREETMSDLPTIIPVFPLPNVVLFPEVILPLHIFEPRYRQMVRDAKDNAPSLI